MNPIQEFFLSARRASRPASAAISVLIVLGALGSLFAGNSLSQALEFLPHRFAYQPWTVLTYPFAYNSTEFLTGIVWSFGIWTLGSSIERQLGIARYIAFWFVTCVLGAVGFALGAEFFNLSGRLATAVIPAMALTVVWGTRNPSAQVRLMFAINISGKVLVWTAVALAFFLTSSKVGLSAFALIAQLFAYLFASDRIPFMKWSAGRMITGIEKREEAKLYSLIDAAEDRKKARVERERLRELFEKSDLKEK